MRMQADRARSNGVGDRIRASATRQDSQDMIVLRPHRANAQDQYEEEIAYASTKRRGLGRDVLLAAAIAIGAVVAYPSIEPHLAYSWRMNIASLTSSFRSAPIVAAQGAAVVVSDLNLRAGPSTGSAVVALLPRGSNVATIEKRGEWMFVQIEADNRAQPRRGWVFGSFLREIEDDEPESSDELD